MAEEFLRDYYRRASKVDLWDSGTEEHNRYGKPPRGASRNQWFRQLMRLKYEFYPGDKSKTEDN